MISELRLQHFRSYQDITFSFRRGINIIVGPNASGKTNLLEAILVVARGVSYRVKDQELIAFDEGWARLDATLASGMRTVKLVAAPASKQYEIDGKAYQRLSLTHTLPVVLFEPNHLSLLTGSPEQRRTYLDDLLEQTTSGFGTTRRNYRRILAQRNALLKRAHKPTNEELFPWNLRLSELGAALSRARNSLSLQIDSAIQKQYQSLSQTETTVGLQYHTQFSVSNYETTMLQKLEHNLSVDRLRGFTTVGPHREDFIIYFGEHPAEETASRGEIRTAVLALKTIELHILEEARDQLPLLLLDDVFSELDASRRQALTEHMEKYQTFITTTDADMMLKNHMSTVQLVRL